MAVATPSRAAPTPTDRLITATEEEQAAVRILDHAMAEVDQTEVALTIRGTSSVLPRPVLVALRQLVAHVARGRAVSLIPQTRQLTPQQAANLLGVSRPHVMKLVREGTLTATQVGAHHRLDLGDVLAYRRARDQAFDATMDELTADAQAAGAYW